LEYRKERQQAGIAVAKKNNIYKGRKPGTTKGKPQRAKELKAKGLAPGEIATALGVSERTVFRYLEKEVA
jgi:DNA invertase Pin-like site-specific DNA recombinase